MSGNATATLLPGEVQVWSHGARVVGLLAGRTVGAVVEGNVILGSGALLLTALGLGVAYAATPGVVNTECLRRGISGGFRPALAVQCGALLGDAAWALAALTGVAALAGGIAVRIGLGLVGGLFLLRLAFRALRGALAPQAEAGAVAGGALRVGLVFGLANPAGIAFWAGVGGGALAAGAPAGDYVRFLTAFLCGALAWSVTLSLLASGGRRFASPALFRTVDVIAGAVLGIFGLRLLWTAWRELRAA
jgi:chemosensory pili system protein ChpE